MRKKIIAANWKMYKTPAEAEAFMYALLPRIDGHDRDEVVICPAYTALNAVVEAARGSAIGVGAQNMFWEKEGAYTGEISAGMLLALGVSHVILGHSERRTYFGETDEAVNRKLKAALSAGLLPIVCVGEKLEQRDSGQTNHVIGAQCCCAFDGIEVRNGSPAFAVAYEPIWAIGTGKTATPEMAGEAHGVIREEAARCLGKEAASRLRILYGGSVKPENTASLMAQPDIDGALVGGASLDPQSFASIVRY